LIAVLVLLAVAQGAAAVGPFGGTALDAAPRDGATEQSLCATARGLFEKRDGEWKRIERFGVQAVSHVAASKSIVLLVAGAGKVFRSQDGGLNWEPVTAGLVGQYGHPVEEVNSLEIDPADASVAYLGSAGKGIFESRDAGRTWVMRAEGLGKEPPAAFHVNAILPPAGKRALLMGTAKGLFSRSDAGWVRVGKGLPENIAVQDLSASPSDPARLALASKQHGLWESRDGGATWTNTRKGEYGVVSAVSVAADGSVLAFFIEEGFVVARDGKASRAVPVGQTIASRIVRRPGGGWAATLRYEGLAHVDEKGVVASFDNGGLDATSVYSFAEGPKPDDLWCGDENGVFFSADRGKNWERRDNGLIVGAVVGLVWREGALYAGIGAQGVYVWNPEKSVWEDRGKALGTANTIRTLLLSRTGRFYVGTEGGVLLSDNGGVEWQRVSTGLPASSFWSLAFDPKDEKTLWAASNAGLYVTHDEGQKWERHLEGSFETVLAARGELWVMEGSKLSRLGKSGLVPVHAAEKGETLLTLLPLEDGVLVGSSQGLARIKGKEVRRMWTDAPVISLFRDSSGNIQAGTDGRGAKTFQLQ
jgi:photosystem II stability/assembly factor-like uncharacterized protein